MESKPFWASRTLWVNGIAGAVLLTGVFGLDLGMTPETQAKVVAGVMVLVNIILRFVTTKAIG